MFLRLTTTLIATGALGIGMLAGPAHAAIWFVDPSATGANDGTSWGDAFPDLEPALSNGSLTPGDQIWVVAATYTPSVPEPSTSTNPRDKTFKLPDGVAIYGGFLGGESNLSERDPENNITILSGDLNGDDGPGAFEDTDDNCYHVVSALSVGNETILNGFTITAGRAIDNGQFSWGGGLYCHESSPRIVRCVFQLNEASYGGGLGAISNSSPQVVNCRFLANAAGTGAGVGLGFASPSTFVNCSFVGNVAAEGGSAITVREHSYPTSVIHCTLTANLTETGGGAVSADDDTTGEYLTLSGCVLWSNSPAEIELTSTSLVRVKYSDVDGGLPQYVDDGGGNIDDDPEFVRAPDPGGDTDWGTGDDDYGDLRLVSTSPCIDVADNGSLPADFGDINTNANDTERTPRDLDVFRKRVLEWTGGFVVDIRAFVRMGLRWHSRLGCASSRAGETPVPPNC